MGHVQSQVDLNELATTIKKHLGRKRASQLEVGRALLTAKSILPHGKFREWVEAEFEMEMRRAQRYMKLAKSMQKIADKYGVDNGKLSYLPVEAICALGNASDEVLRGFVEDIELGFRPPAAQIMNWCAIPKEPNSERGTQPMTAAASETPKIATFPSLKSQFGSEVAEATQRAVKLLSAKMSLQEVVEFNRLLGIVGSDAMTEGLRRFIRSATAASKSVGGNNRSLH